MDRKEKEFIITTLWMFPVLVFVNLCLFASISPDYAILCAILSAFTWTIRFVYGLYKWRNKNR